MVSERCFVNLMPMDVSRTISPEAVAYGGGKLQGMTPLCRIGPGSPWNVMRLDWTTHFLTHVDPPGHGIAGGAILDEIPLERFMGEAVVVEVEGDVIEARH